MSYSVAVENYQIILVCLLPPCCYRAPTSPHAFLCPGSPRLGSGPAVGARCSQGHGAAARACSARSSLIGLPSPAQIELVLGSKELGGAEEATDWSGGRLDSSWKTERRCLVVGSLVEEEGCLEVELALGEEVLDYSSGGSSTPSMWKHSRGHVDSSTEESPKKPARPHRPLLVAASGPAPTHTLSPVATSLAHSARITAPPASAMAAPGAGAGGRRASASRPRRASAAAAAESNENDDLAAAPSSSSSSALAHPAASVPHFSLPPRSPLAAIADPGRNPRSAPVTPKAACVAGTGARDRTSSVGAARRVFDLRDVAAPEVPLEVPHFELDEDPAFWKDRNVQV
ncbi:hypothetical protein HU200_005164 [Digitaria exilis]|uniref:Uncharacterized protein n=1 Tax=Digitaria exilis TaxID=1010633 RepID=A0A835KT62_9POAL|nr:hypothetical protein HU200_005164 [Digitaria exilis]